MKLSELFESVETKALASSFANEAKEHVREWFGTGTFQDICDEPGNCAMVSEKFVSWLHDKNVGAKTLTVFVAKDKSWAKTAGVTSGSEDDAHTAVIVGDNVVDFTARQFDKAFPSIRIVPAAKFKSEWEK